MTMISSKTGLLLITKEEKGNETFLHDCKVNQDKKRNTTGESTRIATGSNCPTEVWFYAFILLNFRMMAGPYLKRLVIEMLNFV